MKKYAENRLAAYKVSNRGMFGRLLSRLLALSIIAAMLFGNAGLAFAEEVPDAASAQTSEAAPMTSEDNTSSEYALAGEGSGQDVTIHFGDDENHAIHIHVNPVRESASPDGEEAGPVSGEMSQTEPGLPLEDETEAETEAETEIGTQKEYTYEDENVKVVATLQYAWAVPDGAELRVTQITQDSKAYNYSAYMDALNESNPDAVVDYSDENTLLYDIAFYVKKLDENGEEIEGSEYEFEPEEGSVDVSVEFKKSQLTEGIGLANSEDVTITHLPLKEDVRKEVDSTAEAVNIQASDIDPEKIAVKDDSVVLRQDDMDAVTFKTDSFSTYAFSNGTATEIQSVQDFDLDSYLGAGNNYGVIANTYVHGGDTETNLMAGTYQSTAAEVGASINYSNAGGNYYFGSFTGFSNDHIVRFHQDPAVVFLGPTATAQYESGAFRFEHLGDGTIVKNSTIDVAAIIRTIDTNFNKLNSLGGTFNKTIDLRQLPAGTYIVRFDGNTIDEGALDLQLNPDQKLIVNCTSTNLKIGRYHIQGRQPSSYIGNTDPSVDWLTTAVVFNMVNDGTVNLEESMGVVINPKGRVTTSGGACAGIMVADSTEGSNEWHYHNHNLESPDSKRLKAVKNIDGLSACVSGFQFELYQKTGSGWELLQTKKNAGQEISFDSILYNGVNCTNEVNEFVYRIKESADMTSVDDTDTEYTVDPTVYYAKIVVTKDTTSSTETIYQASTPVYYSDEACTQELKDVPVFENKSLKTNLKVRKKWKKNGTLLTGNFPADKVSFSLYRVEQTEKAFQVPPTKGGDLVDTYEILKDGEDSSTTADDWALTIPDLPLQAVEGGTTKYYGYYVVENQSIDGYEVSYENYSLTTHEIVISNENDETSITVNKKWFKGTEEASGPADPVIFDLYRIESTTPGAGAAHAAPAEGNASDAERITDYNLTVKWGKDYLSNTENTIPVHAGDEVQIVARGLSNLQATSIISGGSYYLQRELEGTKTVVGSKTFFVNEYYTPTYDVYETTFVYTVPTIEKTNPYDTTKVYNCELQFVFRNIGVPDDEANVSSMVKQSGGGLTHSQVLSQGGTNDWDDQIHRYSLSAQDGWTRTIPSLKTKGKDSTGQTVYYSYYVVEHDGAAFKLADTVYQNNQGIQSGEITICNKLPDYKYTYTNIDVTKQWLGDGNQDISSKKGGKITFVLKHVLYHGTEPVANGDKTLFTGGVLEPVDGVTYNEASGEYTITALPDGTDSSGKPIWRWPTASISRLPWKVETEDGILLYEYKYVVEEIGKNGEVDATYIVNEGRKRGYCKESNNGSDVTIINREMEAYSLPATGGEGTHMIYLMSLLLIGLAGAGLITIRRRRERTR